MNLYETLGITQTATPEEIKAAFRTKALQYHPDRNPNNPDAEAKFKEINAAYEVLGDQDKRIAYDQSKLRASTHRNFVPIETMFKDFFGGFTVKAQQTITHHPHFKANITLTLAETLQTQAKDIVVTLIIKCIKCLGTAVGKGERCKACSGSPECKTCNGLGVHFPMCDKCNGTGVVQEQKEVKVNIPRGLFSNTQLQLKIPQGTVLANITIQYPENIKLGANGRIIMDVSIPYHVAILGGTHPVDLIEGGKINVKFPPLKNQSQLIKIKEKGIYAGPYASERGDLFLSPHIAIPDNISKDHKTIIEQLANLYNKEDIKQ